MRLGGNGDLLEIVQEIKVDHTTKCYNNQFWRMRHKILWVFEIQTDHLILARR